MKINEIEYGHWMQPTLPEDQPITDGTKLGEFDGYSIFQVDDYLFIPDESMHYMGYIRLDGNTLREAYVSSVHRRKGIASILVLFALRNVSSKLVISSNEIVTDDSRRLYYNLAAANKIKITSDGKQLSQDELAVIFKDISDNDITLVIEGKSKLTSETCFEIRNPNTNLAESNVIIFGKHVRQVLWFV